MVNNGDRRGDYEEGWELGGKTSAGSRGEETTRSLAVSVCLACLAWAVPPVPPARPAAVRRQSNVRLPSTVCRLRPRPPSNPAAITVAFALSAKWTLEHFATLTTYLQTRNNRNNRKTTQTTR